MAADGAGCCAVPPVAFVVDYAVEDDQAVIVAVHDLNERALSFDVVDGAADEEEVVVVFSVPVVGIQEPVMSCSTTIPGAGFLSAHTSRWSC